MDDYSELQRENEEQARLLGASAERECDLRGKVDRLERELAAAQDEIAQLGREQYAAERELAVLRESYAYAEISLPDELIPATRAASKEEAK